MMNQPKMSSSMEIVTDFFIAAAFKTAHYQHPQIETDEELMPYVLELLFLANSRFKETMHVDNDQSQAIYDIRSMFRQLCPYAI